MNKERVFFWLGMMSAMCGWSAQAKNSSTDCMPVLESGWIRLMPAPMAMLGGFGTIRNPCSESIAIVAAQSSFFGAVSIHETVLKNDVSMMREVERLSVESSGIVELRPGGLHLMLMQPRVEVRAGDRIPIELVLEDGRLFTVELEARSQNRSL